MASVNLSLAVVVALFSGFVILGAVVGVDECGFLCVEGTYVSCENYPQDFPGCNSCENYPQDFPGCNCVCAPADGDGCAIYGDDGLAHQYCYN